LKRACKEIPAPVFALWANTIEPAPTNREYADLGARMIMYPIIAATWGLDLLLDRWVGARDSCSVLLAMIFGLASSDEFSRRHYEHSPRQRKRSSERTTRP
jgi:hypothetical protein